MEQTKKVVLSENNGFIYTVYKSTQEEVNEIEKNLLDNSVERDLVKYPFLKYIYLCGGKHEIHLMHFKDCIPEPRLVRDISTTTEKTIYKQEFICYAYKNRKKQHNIIMHNECISSFKCALSTMNADWFYVLKESKELVNKENIINGEQPVSNKDRDTEVHTESEDVGETKS